MAGYLFYCAVILSYPTYTLLHLYEITPKPEYPIPEGLVDYIKQRKLARERGEFVVLMQKIEDWIDEK